MMPELQTSWLVEIKKVNYLSPRTNIQERPNRSDDDQLS